VISNLKWRVNSLSFVQGGAWQICSQLEEVVGKNRVHLNTPVIAIRQVFSSVSLAATAAAKP